MSFYRIGEVIPSAGCRSLDGDGDRGCAVDVTRILGDGGIDTHLAERQDAIC